MHLRYIAFLSIFLSTFSFAEDGGIGFNVYAKAGSVSVSDPDGDAGSVTAVSPGGEVSFDTGSRDSRFVFGASLLSADIDAEDANINQEISGYNLYAGYQKQVAFTRNVKVWFSGSLAYSAFDFENRYIVDEEDYLIESFDNRSITGASLLLSADKYFSLGSGLDFGVGVFVDMPTDDGVQMVGLKISLGNNN